MRAGLIGLLREWGSITSTDAARALGHSTGLCSFHLRQLARYGYVEEVTGPGRTRPWRLRPVDPPVAGTPSGTTGTPDVPDVPDADFGRLNRGLEDESYRRWLEQRDDAPDRWRVDQAFSSVLHLTPAELVELAGTIRALLSRYADRDLRPITRPADAAPVAVLTRLFPLLPTTPTPAGPDRSGGPTPSDRLP